MINKDIYNHLKNGGTVEELQKVFAKEIDEAEARIQKEKEAAEKKQKQEQVIQNCRDKTLKALLEYAAACEVLKDETHNYGYVMEDFQSLLELIKERNITFKISDWMKIFDCAVPDKEFVNSKFLF